MLSCYRVNDGSRSWRELLLDEWRRRGGREVLEATLTAKLNQVVGRNLLPRVELERIEKRIMKLMTSQGALVAIKTEEEDEEAFADRTILDEMVDEVEWKETGCYRGVISEVYQEVLEHYQKENLPVVEAFENWWEVAIVREKEFLRTAREEDQLAMSMKKVVKAEEVDFDMGPVEGRDVEAVLHVDVVECLEELGGFVEDVFDEVDIEGCMCEMTEMVVVVSDVVDKLVDDVGSIVDEIEDDLILSDALDIQECMHEMTETVEAVSDVVSLLVNSVGNLLDDNCEVNITKLVTWKDGDVLKVASEEQIAVLRRIKEVYAGTEVQHIPSLKNKNRKEVNAETDLVNGLLHHIGTKNISETNRLMYASAFVIAERLGMIKKRNGGPRKKKKEPWWKRRIERSIIGWRRDLAQVGEMRRGRVKNTSTKAKLEAKYGLGDRGFLYVEELLKGKIHEGTCKVKSYEKRNMQYQQNTLFKNDQKQLYSQLSGEGQSVSDAPDPKEATAFWSGIWSNPVEHNRKAEWISKVKQDLAGVEQQDDLVIGVEEVRAGVRRMTNWRAPGPDGIQGFWFKKFSSLHSRIADGLQECLTQGWVPKWMTLGRTSLFMKDPAKGTAADNYRPIACLPLMWKLLTGIFSEKMYQHLEDQSLLPDEQKGCRKNSRGTKDQLLIDKMILKDAKKGSKNLAMAWIDYKKAYDMVPHSWILEALDMFKVAGNMADLLRCSMDNWRTQLMGNGNILGTVNIERGIFQGDSLSPLLFVMIMIPLSMRLKSTDLGFNLRNESRSINHLLFMDDLKLYARTPEQLEELVGLVKGYSDDIKMEFGMSKCQTVILKRGKRQRGDGLELPDGNVMKDVDEQGYKYLGVLQKDSMMAKEMKEKVKK